MNLKEIKAPLWDGTLNNINYNFNFLSESHRRIQTQINDLVLDAGESNQEVAQARGGHQVLADRLNSVDSQLAQTHEVIDEVSGRLNDKRDKSVPIGLNDAGTDLLAAVQNKETETPFNLLSIPKPKSVTPDKTTFLKTSTNLFNKSNLYHGYNIDNVTGELVEQEGFNTSEFIPIKPSMFYSYWRIAKFAWYDENYQFFDTRTTISPVQAFNNVSYVRVVVEDPYIDVAQINEGEILLPYEEYKTEFDKSENFVFPEPSVSKSWGRLINEPKYVDFDWNSNLLKITGNQAVRLLHRERSYLLKPQTVNLPTTGFHKLTYDLADNQVKIISTSTDTPDDAVFFGAIDAKRKLVFNVNSYYVNGEEGSDSGESLSDKVYFMPPDIPTGWYESGEVEGYDASSHYSDDITLDYVYDSYDEMVSSSPDYASRQFLGNDSTDTYPIYRYEFKPDDVESTLFEKTMPKIIIFTNTHGEEKSSTISLRNFMRDVCNKWETDSLLEFIRFNVHIIIIPVVNPWGFVNYTRKNGNGVDINRNCSFRWPTSDNTDPEASTYKGTAPFSEKEAQYIRDTILEHKDAIACFDYHMNGSSGETYRGLFWHYLENFQGVWGFDETNTVAKYDISKITRESQKRYGVSEDSGFIGYISYNTSSSTIAAYAFSEGIPGATIECTKKFVGDTNVYSAETMQLCTEFIGNKILSTVRAFAK